MKKIVCLIGARSNPKMEEWRLGGYPLVVWPYTASLRSKYIQQRTWISTNSTVIPELFSRYRMDAKFIDRPEIFATDTATDLQWIIHALEWLRSYCIKPDLIVHLRATTPLVTSEVIDDAIAKFLQCPEATSLRSAHAMNESPHKLFLKDSDYWKPYMAGVGEFFNEPRQRFPTAYQPNGYVDILRPEIIDSGVLHGDKILAFETEPVIEIDRKSDLELLQKIYQTHPAYLDLIRLT